MVLICRSIPGRVVKNVWSLATIILMSLYTAKLYTLLKTERTQLTIESANDLVSQTEIKYGLIHGGSTEAFFRVGGFSNSFIKFFASLIQFL